MGAGIDVGCLGEGIKFGVVLLGYATDDCESKYLAMGQNLLGCRYSLYGFRQVGLEQIWSPAGHLPV